MSTPRLHLIAACVLALAAAAAPAGAADTRPRLIITTDIGGDPDDQQSLVRLLLYSNEFDLEGLIASASGTPGELGQAIVRPDIIRAQIDAYAQVHASLLRHSSAYPSAAALRALVKPGNPQRGVPAIGAGKDTEGSEWIIAVVDRSDARPVDIAIWGGQTDLGQALWKVKTTRSASAYQQFASRIRVHDINDQDGIYAWLRGMFPEVWYILDQSQDGVKCNSAYRGMFYQGDTATVTQAWIAGNIAGHGALSELYPRDGLWSCGNGINGIKEGDTPSWFYFLRHGLNDPAEPTWGGWGGRFQREGSVWRDAQDTVNGVTSRTATVWRWRPVYQAEFQARLDWCVRDFAGANHPPAALLNGQGGREVVRLTVNSGQNVVLSAGGSSDPDGHALTYRWFHYREPGTHAGAITLHGAATAQASFTAPAVSSAATIHVVLEVKDGGTPALTSFRRVVVQVEPAVGQPTPPLTDDAFSDGVIDPRWQRTGDLPLAERNGRLEVTTANGTSTWRGGGLFLREAVDVGGGIIYRARIGIPDVSPNQFAEATLAPALLFDGEGQPQEFVRLAVRGTTMTLLTGRSGARTTLWSAGGVTAGQVLAVELVYTAQRITLAIDGVQRFDGAHGLPWTRLHPGFRAANRDDPAGGLAWFDEVAIRRPATAPVFAGAAINFQPAGAATPSGMVADTGAVFGVRGDGLSYGWNVANPETRERNSGAAPDQAHDTLNHLQKAAGLRWELALPSGWYEVRIVRGDPAYTDQVNHLVVEGVSMADPDGQDRFDDDTLGVQVSDGRLTVVPAANAVNAKVCFIEVVALPTGGG